MAQKWWDRRQFALILKINDSGSALPLQFERREAVLTALGAKEERTPS
jgi:hypothetical protein